MANVSTTDIRTYLKSLKDGSTVNVAKFLNRKKVTDPTKRGIASGNFKRIIEEFSLKKLELIRLLSDQMLQREKQTKIAKEVYKEDIKKFKNFNDLTKNKINIKFQILGQNKLHLILNLQVLFKMILIELLLDRLEDLTN